MSSTQEYSFTSFFTLWRSHSLQYDLLRLYFFLYNFQFLLLFFCFCLNALAVDRNIKQLKQLGLSSFSELLSLKCSTSTSKVPLLFKTNSSSSTAFMIFCFCLLLGFFYSRFVLYREEATLHDCSSSFVILSFSTPPIALTWSLIILLGTSVFLHVHIWSLFVEGKTTFYTGLSMLYQLYYLPTPCIFRFSCYLGRRKYINPANLWTIFSMSLAHLSFSKDPDISCSWPDWILMVNSPSFW